MSEVEKKTTKSTNKKVKKYTFDEVVIRTINGLYGFGEKRKELIEKEGYTYSKVLKAINGKRGFN